MYLSKNPTSYNEEELFKILEINNDILTINPDSEVVPRLDFGQYPMIVNRKGYFYVNNILHKVTNDKMYVAKTTGETDLDEIILNDGEKSDRVIIINNKIIQLTKSCTGDHSAEITEGNRRAKIYMSAYVAFANDGYYWYCQDYVDWTIKGFKKVLGIWYSYNTLYTYRNVAFEVNSMYDIYYEIPHDYQQTLPEFRVQSGSYPGPVETTVESKSATWSAPVGDLIKSSSFC